MNVRRVADLHTPIGEILKAAEPDGVLLEAELRRRYALLPLDEGLIDYLLEHHPRFIEDCRRIRRQMDAGEFSTHDEVKRLLT